MLVFGTWTDGAHEFTAHLFPFPMNSFAFVAQGRLYVQTSRGVREVPSQFGENIRRRETEIQQRNAWKMQGMGARFMGFAGRNAAEADPAEMPIHVTSVAPGTGQEQILYTLETPVICGMLRSERFGEEEHRLWHSNERRIGDLCRHSSEARFACSVRNTNGTASIAAMNADGGGLEVFTEGDSVDAAPRWIPGSTSRLVFQSAGLARGSEGIFCGIGPFAVHELDTATGHMEMIAESPECDMLAPQFDVAGILYFIRRPYDSGLNRPWWQTLLDVLLLPVRLLQAFFGFLNFFSMLFTGKPLMTQAGGPRRQMDAGRMILWGNFVDAQKAIRRARGAEAPDLVPKSWELVRREPGGLETVLARSVISYDLQPDGSILYTNGSAIFRRSPDGSIEKLAKHSFIQQVVALPGKAEPVGGETVHAVER